MPDSPEEFYGVILAAGAGKRMGGLTSDRPKALLDIGGKPLVSYTIGFLRNVGATHLLALGGFCCDKLQSAVSAIDPDIETICCDAFGPGGATLGNFHTLYQAREKIRGSMMVIVGDHIFRCDIADKIRRALGAHIAAVTDQDRVLGPDDMKVKTTADGRWLLCISKTLTEFERGYVGIIWCPERALGDYWSAGEEAIRRFGNAADVVHPLEILAERGVSVEIVDMSGSWWGEIDTPEDLDRVRKEVGERPNDYDYDA
ncbi:MAG: NTP transferase domain-containing protein [Patescibacteria group bacterium]